MSNLGIFSLKNQKTKKPLRRGNQMCKKIIVFLIFCFSVSENVNGQIDQEQFDNLRRQPFIQAVPGINLIQRIIYFNSSDGFVAGQGGIYTTTNSGRDWLYAIGGSNMHLYDAKKQNSLTAYAVGSTMETPLLRYVFKTTDAGATWESVLIPGNNPLYAISISGNTIEIFGSGNELIVSVDNGNSWQVYNGSNGWNFVPSDVLRKGNMLFVGIGHLYKSNDRINWEIDQNLTEMSAEVMASNGNNIFVAGFGLNSYKSMICMSRNSGETWRKITLPGYGYITGIKFKNPMIGYACGAWRRDSISQTTHGIIYKTIDGGRSWHEFYRTRGEEYGLRDIETMGNRVIFSLTQSLWLFKDNIHDMKDFEETDSKSQLNQNYPNPFNPTTKISFNLPMSGLTTLAIYDISGREVVQLVNEVKTAGSYSVKFNGSNLSSGVYYYSLSAGSFTETKKMILIK
jgi:photosystem II stability/assembly factor-like uncharacterized protein